MYIIHWNKENIDNPYIETGGSLLDIYNPLKQKNISNFFK